MLEKKMSIVILAAGKSTRMQSNYPKVLHLLGGKTLLEHVIHTAKSIKNRKIIIVYNDIYNDIPSKIQDQSLEWIIQKKPLGTGDAVIQASKKFLDDEDILVLYGDVPFISKETINKLKTYKEKNKIILLTMKVDQPNGYGRVLRKNGKVISIIEDRDLNIEEKKIQEIYSGIFIANGKDLRRWAKKINNNNSQEEYYITDIVSLADKEKCFIPTIEPREYKEILGINNKLQLSIAEEIIQKENINQLLLNGVMLKNASNFILRGTLKHGKDIEIDTNVILEGNIILGKNITIGAGCIIKNSIIQDNSTIQPYSILENVKIGKNCIIGPFAHLKKNTLLKNDIHIGNFVEVKDSTIEKKSKIKHLSYLGNAEIGAQVNIGAGSITCNYDGINKSKTIIGDNVFIGSNTSLIAPITIVKNTTIAAGTIVTKDVNTSCLVYNNKTQKEKKKWIRPIKKL